MEPLDHQRQAHDEIVSRARAYFVGGWQGLSVTPRWASLVAGPTGSGKTTIAAMAAATLTREFGEESEPVSTLVLSTPSWIPLGAHNRGAKETLGAIAAHIARHKRTILVLDELDKLVSGAGGVMGHGGDTWQSYIRGELYSVVLDGKWPAGFTMPDMDDAGEETAIEELTRKLKNTVFVLGLGTFQGWFDSASTRRSMGFGAEIAPPSDELTAGIIAEQMPRELSNRFHSSIIRLPELRVDDYHRIALDAEIKLPEHMRPAFRIEAEKRIPTAMAAKKGVRFIEEAVTEVLKNLPPGQKPHNLEIAEHDPKTDAGPCMP